MGKHTSLRVTQNFNLSLNPLTISKASFFLKHFSSHVNLLVISNFLLDKIPNIFYAQ